MGRAVVLPVVLQGRRSGDERRPMFRVPTQGVVVEILAEEVVDRGWTGALVERLVPYGDVFFQFVVRERAPGLRTRRTILTSDPFPVARPGLHDVAAQGAWLDLQTARLREVQRHLAEDGWEPAGRGEHWWSARYAPPVEREAAG